MFRRRLGLYLGPYAETMPLSEYMEWKQCIDVEGGFPHEITHNLLADLCALVANLMRGKGGRRAKRKDFLPERRDPRPVADKWRAYADSKRKR